jgi:hypothetical protein
MASIASLLSAKIAALSIDISCLLTQPNDFNPKTNTDIDLLRSIIIKRLKEKPKSSTFKLYKLLNISENDILKKETIKLSTYFIFGCPLSTDVDIAFVVNSPDIILHYKSGQIIFDYNNILDDLKQIYPTQDFDINLIAVDVNNNISMALKGSKETQNIIYHTYKYHPQKYQLIFNKQIDIDLNDKIRGLAVFILDYLKDIIGIEEYKKQREIKKRIYNEPAERITYVNEILSTLSVDIDKNIIKPITMKLIQIILLNDDIYAYTKKEMVERVNVYFEQNFENELWNLLLRDTYHIQSNSEQKQIVFNLLVERYIKIYNDMIMSYQWSFIDIDFTQNPTNLSNDIISEFIKSPLIMTPKFSELGRYILDDNINKHFILPVYGNEYLSDIHKYIIYEPQRSEQWIKLHQEANEGKIKICGDKYSIIRGAIGEMFITSYCDFDLICGEHVSKSMVGFVKDDFCNMCAPDLLLINDKKEIIPVEIKCLPMDVCFDVNNRAFYREFKLAKKQIYYISEIINNIYEKININKKIKKGIIIFAYFTQEYIKTYYCIINT